jgi:hypothetical protein
MYFPAQLREPQLTRTVIVIQAPFRAVQRCGCASSQTAFAAVAGGRYVSTPGTRPGHAECHNE